MKSFKTYLKEELRETKLSPEQEMDFQRHESSFEPKHVRSIKNYKYESNNFNGDLRYEKFHHPDTIEHYLHKNIEDLDHVTNRPMSHEYILYRGISQHKESSRIKNMKPGDTFTDHGYTGTSLSPDVAMDHTSLHRGKNHLIKIHAPVGTKGHFVDLNSGLHQDEKELVLHRGIKFEVLHHEDDHIAHITHVKVIGNHPKKVVPGT